MPDAAEWTKRLPTLTGVRVRLREPRSRDARLLHQIIQRDEVSRFVSAPPSSAADVARFISLARRRRRVGEWIVYTVFPAGDASRPVGLIQVRKLSDDLSLGEWGFCFEPGQGWFVEAAELLLEFVFETVGLHRLEARVVVENKAAARALVALGANIDGRLHEAFRRHGRYWDQQLWSILADDWRRVRAMGRRSPCNRRLRGRRGLGAGRVLPDHSYCFNPAVQFNTTVNGTEARGPTGAIRRNRFPSAVTSPTIVPGGV